MHLDLQKFWSVWRVRCMRNGIKSLLKLWRNKQKPSPTCSHNCGVFHACSFSDLHSSHSATSLIIYQSCSELFFSYLLNHGSCFFFFFLGLFICHEVLLLSSMVLGHWSFIQWNSYWITEVAVFFFLGLFICHEVLVSSMVLGHWNYTQWS